jgi:hypothetical protein
MSGKSPFSNPARVGEHPKDMRRVVLESPFAGAFADNIGFAQACLRDCLLRGEAPFASHLLYAQLGVLDENHPHERARGINAGHAWYHGANAVVVYTDRGISPGMEAGIRTAEMHGVPVEYRRLDAVQSAESVRLDAESLAEDGS